MQTAYLRPIRLTYEPKQYVETLGASIDTQTPW